MVETLEAWAGFLIILIFLSFIIAGIFMWIGVKITRIRNYNFKRVILTAILTSLVTYMVTVLFSAFPIINTIHCFFIGLFLSFFIIKSVFDSTLKQAILVWIFNIFAQVLTVILGASLFVGGIRYLLKII